MLRSRGVVALLAVVVATGCGYHFTGTGRSFAPEVHTLGVEALINDTREFGLEKRIALALEREFAMRGPLRIAASPSAGDLVLSGRIRQAEDRPVAFNRNDEVLVYHTVVALDLDLRRRETGDIVWQARGLRATGDYETVASVIVATSSEFRSSTLNAEDLGAFTDIQLAESRRRQMMERMIGGLARDVYDQIMEGF